MNIFIHKTKQYEKNIYSLFKKGSFLLRFLNIDFGGIVVSAIFLWIIDIQSIGHSLLTVG